MPTPSPPRRAAAGDIARHVQAVWNHPSAPRERKCSRAKPDAVGKLPKLYIFDDDGMRGNPVSDIAARLGRISGNKTFLRALSNPANAWLDVPAGEAVAEIAAFIASLA